MDTLDHLRLIAASRRAALDPERVIMDRRAFATRSKALQACLQRWERREKQAEKKKDRDKADLARRRQEAVRGLLLDLERRYECSQ